MLYLLMSALVCGSSRAQNFDDVFGGASGSPSAGSPGFGAPGVFQSNNGGQFDPDLDFGQFGQPQPAFNPQESFSPTEINAGGGIDGGVDGVGFAEPNPTGFIPVQSTFGEQLGFEPSGDLGTPDNGNLDFGIKPVLTGNNPAIGNAGEGNFGVGNFGSDGNGGNAPVASQGNFGLPQENFNGESEGNFGLVPTQATDTEGETVQFVNGSVTLQPLAGVNPTNIAPDFTAPEQDLFPGVALSGTTETNDYDSPDQPAKGSCYWNDEPYPAASRVDHGSFWYECVEESFVPKGCFSDFGERLFFGQTYNTSNGYLMRCSQTVNGTFHIHPVGCLHQGQQYKTGDTFQDEFYWYTCVMQGEQMIKTVSGCVNNDLQRINVGGTLHVGEYLYECMLSPDGNGMWFAPIACMQKGIKYEVNEKMIDGLFWFKCTKKSDDFIMAELGGCVHGNSTLDQGQKYYLEGFVYRCEKDNYTGSFTHTLTGCLETDPLTSEVISERAFGESWPVGDAPFMLMTKCERLGPSGASQKLTHCMYTPSVGNNTILLPGCYKTVEPDMMMMCLRRGDGSLSVDQASPSDMFRVRREGLVEC